MLLSGAMDCGSCWCLKTGKMAGCLAPGLAWLQQRALHHNACCPALYLGMADPLQGILLEVVGAWELETRIACPLCSSHQHLAAVPHTCSCINSSPWASCKTPCVCLPCMCQPCTKASVLRELGRAGRGEVRACNLRQGLTY